MATVNRIPLNQIRPGTVIKGRGQTMDFGAAAPSKIIQQAAQNVSPQQRQSWMNTINRGTNKAGFEFAGAARVPDWFRNAYQPGQLPQAWAFTNKPQAIPAPPPPPPIPGALPYGQTRVLEAQPGMRAGIPWSTESWGGVQERPLPPAPPKVNQAPQLPKFKPLPMPTQGYGTQHHAKGGPVLPQPTKLAATKVKPTKPIKKPKFKKPMKTKSFKKPKPQQQVLPHFAEGGAVMRFMQDYPDFQPGEG